MTMHDAFKLAEGRKLPECPPDRCGRCGDTVGTSQRYSLTRRHGGGAVWQVSLCGDCLLWIQVEGTRAFREGEDGDQRAG